MNYDLFGGESETVPKPLTIKEKMGYRLAVDDKQCKNCKYLMRKNHHDIRYYKCQWIGTSACESSDVHLKRVCNRFSIN